MRHLFAGIDAYLRMLRSEQRPIFTGSFGSDEERRAAFEKWTAENDEAITRSLRAQRAFRAESYALTTLCGAVLQIASTAIRRYSKNSFVPDEFVSIVKNNRNAKRHCIGRLVRGVPIGLLIYAGRNQYAHIDDTGMHAVSASIFERLSTGHGYGDDIRDPAFEPLPEVLGYLPSNVMSVMDWRSYEVYEEDIRDLLLDPDKADPNVGKPPP